MANYNENGNVVELNDQEIDMLLIVLAQITNGSEDHIEVTKYNNTISDCYKAVTTVEYAGKTVYGEFHSHSKEQSIRMSIVNLMDAVLHYNRTGEFSVCNLK